MSEIQQKSHYLHKSYELVVTWEVWRKFLRNSVLCDKSNLACLELEIGIETPLSTVTLSCLRRGVGLPRWE